MPFESRPDNDAVNKLLCHDGPEYLCKVCGASFVRSNHGKSHIRLKHQVEVLNEIQASDNAAAEEAVWYANASPSKTFGSLIL